MTKLNLPIHYSQPSVTTADIKAAERVLRSSWLTTGPELEKWEKSVAEFTGYRFAVSVSNATAGLYISAEWFFNKLEKPKWVSVPTLTFVATANSVERLGIPIKFADADDKLLTTQTFDLSVSLCGYPLMGSGLIADDAHFFREGMNKFGDYRCRVVSHHAVKNLGNSGEGGTILTNDFDFAEFAKEYRNHGRDKNGEAVFVGQNYRITDIQAALLLSQLDRWYEDHHRRHEIAEFYRAELGNSVKLPAYNKAHSLHLFPITFHTTEQRDFVRQHLLERKVYTQIHYKPVHMQPLYRDRNLAVFPVAEEHYCKSLSIPLHTSLNDEECNYIVNEIKLGIELYDK